MNEALDPASAQSKWSELNEDAFARRAAQSTGTLFQASLCSGISWVMGRGVFVGELGNSRKFGVPMRLYWADVSEMKCVFLLGWAGGHGSGPPDAVYCATTHVSLLRWKHPPLPPHRHQCVFAALWNAHVSQLPKVCVPCAPQKETRASRTFRSCTPSKREGLEWSCTGGGGGGVSPLGPWAPPDQSDQRGKI